MRPSKLRSGMKLLITPTLGVDEKYPATFKKRTPAQAGRKAINLIQADKFRGLHGPDDDGSFEMSDYDLSRCGELA